MTQKKNELAANLVEMKKYTTMVNGLFDKEDILAEVKQKLASVEMKNDAVSIIYFVHHCD